MRHATNMQTPWGQADHASVVAEGIVFYTTPSHGGYHLSPERLAEMPANLRAFQPFCGQEGWYEEDCDWAVVCLAFPQFFAPKALEAARAMAKSYDKLAAAIVG